MYLRETRQRRADGSVITHLQLAESVWNPRKGRSETHIVYNCGRAEDPAVTERLRRLARSILRRAAPEDIVAEHPGWQVVNAWPFGEVYVLEALWTRLGIAEVIGQVVGGRRFDFPVERALFARVANRACAPARLCSGLQALLLQPVAGGRGAHRRHRALGAAASVPGDGLAAQPRRWPSNRRSTSACRRRCESGAKQPREKRTGG
jgi:hypothetical protein